MKSILLILISTVIALSSFPKKKSTPISAIEKDMVYYNLKIVTVDDGLEFHVDLKYRSDSIHKVLLPFDYYGTPDLHQWVKSFQVENGTTITEVGSNFRKVAPNLNGEVHINYKIRYNPEELDKYSYAPNVSNSFFYIAGCQWLLPIYPLEKKLTYKISMKSDNPQWILYSSLSRQVDTITVESSYENLISTGFGGNMDASSQETFDLDGVNYSVFVNGNFNFDKADFFEQLKETIKAEKDFFSDKDQSFYHITILPRTGLLAGASIPHLFYCFVDKKESAGHIQDLISHEYFHNWLPNKMYLPTLRGEYDFKHEWLHEGFTEYFSRKILFEKRIISKKQLVELFNKDIISIRNNPSANESYLTIASRDNFGAAQKKLSYYRGPLLALRWDHQLSKKRSSLKKMMQYLYKNSRNSNGAISYENIFDYGKRFSLDFEQDIKDFIINGKNIPLEPNAFEGYRLTHRTIQLFYPGFDVSKSSKEKIIRGVDPNGPAHKAGLRNGMKYLKRENSNRWSNSWSGDKPYIVSVINNDHEKHIRFFPHGNKVDVRLYEKL
ncbi:hypothetical protein [Flagellimonas lutimaris]|uniref:M61 family metallopeptidase n=1 Tax=Flagellimonas lutimaris TaxID=475082 RepID=UPI003F5CF458